jgi:hypothetical protein
MKAAFFLSALLLFATFVASGFYASLSFYNYQQAVPKPPVVGIISAIRNSFGRLHDPEDPDVSQECFEYLRRAKIGALIAVTTWLTFAVLVIAVRTLGLNQYLE